MIYVVEFIIVVSGDDKEHAMETMAIEFMDCKRQKFHPLY